MEWTRYDYNIYLGDMYGTFKTDNHDIYSLILFFATAY